MPFLIYSKMAEKNKTYNVKNKDLEKRFYTYIR